MSASRLLKYARSVVAQVNKQVLNQVNIVEDSIMKQIENMVRSTVDGMWRGKGAEAFVGEMNSLVLPKLREMVGGCRRTTVNVDRASEIMHTADAAALGKFNSLTDTFRNIY